MNCAVELCPRDALLSGLCTQHRKKAIAGELEFDEDGTIWDTCSKGHRWTRENTHMESNSKGGRRRRCRKCLAAKAQRKRDEPSPVEAPAPLRAETPKGATAVASFDSAQSTTKTKCADNYEQWTDYTAANMPTPEKAADMCAGCPFFKACANTAAATRPAWGVWAGEVWVYEKKYNGEDGVLDADD